ncbi:thymus-specific serine protease-like [Ptychodera flava]|uniref:thymus-specific serine protease-like n=1 Tax=Ptychodera flava TaxID=63121 RepID=UPI003969F575
MKRLLLACLSLLCVCNISNAIIGTHFWKFRAKVEQYRRERQLKSIQRWQNKIPELGKLYDKEFEDLYLPQPLDHFDPVVSGVYQQRYWMNSVFWNQPNGPVFLYIGGEGALSSAVVQSGEHVDLAMKYGALIFAVEHRFYGASINPDGLKIEQMQYLSSQQALADLATFHSFAVSKYNLSESNTWICFGGSYPGSLSAWFRLKYPHLVYGSIASSAPVLAQTNFEGYNDVVAASLSDPVVKGSTQCAANVKAAFKTVDQLIQEKQFEKLRKDFISCDDITNPNDTATFISNLADLFMGVVQYNNEMPKWTIEFVCENMTKPGNPYDNLVKLSTAYLVYLEEECADNSFQNMIIELRNTTVRRQANMRQWTYQTCTQFGYYQTCDSNTTCVFSPLMDLKSNILLCTEVFGITRTSVDQRVDFTNAYYGGQHPKGSRIVFVNGSIDPWHALSVLHNESPTETSIFINGTAHCANMGESRPTDPPSLIKARMQIDAKIGQWLQEARKV